MIIMSIFRSYDIRGIYGKDLDENIMKRIGATFSSISTETIAVASDMRISSPSLKKAFIEGCNKKIIDCGCVPLGVGMIHALGKHDYAYITASHMPKEWNGVKFFHKNGIGFAESENKKISQLFSTIRAKGHPEIVQENVTKLLDNYRKYIREKIKIGRKICVVLDCGNGMAGVVAKQLFSDSGFDVETIYEKLDGTFPNRGPEPSEDELKELRKKSKSADIGIAYDGDGDRMLLVDNLGRKLTPEQASYLVLLGAVNEKGPIVANVECTRLIDDIAKKIGKKIIRVPVGHTFLMQAVSENKACFGMEVSGHYALPYMAPIDDSLMVSIYAAAVLSKQNKKLSEIIDTIKTYPFERVNLECDDEKKFIIINNLKQKFRKEYKNVTTMDGVRVDFPNGWVLIRASNTTPLIRLSIEAEDEKTLKILKKNFSLVLQEEIKKCK